MTSDAAMPADAAGLIAHAPIPIALLDLDGRVAEANAAFHALCRDAEGAELVDLLSPPDRGELVGQMSKLVMGTGRAAHLDVHLATPDATAMAVALSRIDGPDGDCVAVLAHLLDTSEQKSLERQFAQSQKMQALGQLAGGIAHDFNNLLTATNGFCELLLARHGPDDDSHDDLVQIKQNGERASSLVRQLLAFSRQQTLQPRVVRVNDLLGDLSAMLRRVIGETVTLDIGLAPDAPPVRVDPAEFDRIVVNLAVNARDAMPGGGKLSIQTGLERVTEAPPSGEEGLSPGDYVAVTVADEGSGIVPEHLDRIFDPFFTTKEAGKGIGLGLSSVYGIVRQTGGHITVDSSPGAGTRFRIFLPALDAGADVAAVRPAAAPAPAGPAAAAGAAAGKLVLLVEDEDAVRKLGEKALSSAGFTVLSAPDGEAALAALDDAGRPIDVLVSDVVMPGIDGPTLVRMVRERDPAVRVVLISGYADAALGNQFELGEQIRFLPKPFAVADLLSTVREAAAVGRGQG
jgi:two-component system cell cycle sensor histidine kinase/response regulator CckA